MRRIAPLVLLLFVACTGDDDNSDGAGSTLVPVTASDDRATATEVPLGVGECAEVDVIAVGVALDPATLRVVPCAQEHAVEVAAVFDYPAGPDLDYPGAGPVDGRAADECAARFAEYVGRPYAESTLDVAFVSPSEDGWDDGDRRLACLVYHADFAPLTGSVRNSGL